MSTEDTPTGHEVTDNAALETSLQIVRQMSRSKLERYYGTAARAKRAKIEDQNPLNMVLKMAFSPSVVRLLNRTTPVDARFEDDKCVSQPHCLLEMDSQVQKAFQTFGRDFPTAIWTCCARRCFAHVAILPEHSGVFNAVLKIHNTAEALHEKIEGVDKLVPTRKRGLGRSSLVVAAKARPKSKPKTDRAQLKLALKNSIAQFLPYLRGKIAAPDGTLPPTQPFCYEAICQMLGVHRNTLFKIIGGEGSVIDSAGVRQRRFRRLGSRKGFKAISELPTFQCGCDSPCFTGLRIKVLQRLWDEFKAIAAELSPREKEHRYLMNQMFCPLTNTSVRVCNRAIAQLYTISEALVASIRLNVHQMCEDPSIEELPVREHGMKRYRERNHPLNRFSSDVIERVETHLDMFLRPDPAAADGINVCRVYSPEVNTHEKLRKLVAQSVKVDIAEVNISPTSLQRMIKSYLERRGCRLSFSQSDHNACPMCKSYQYELLYLHYEKKQLSQKLSPYEGIPRPMLQLVQEDFDRNAAPLVDELVRKEYRETEATYELRCHNFRDACIRGWLKEVTDYLRGKENNSREQAIKTGILEPYGWCQRRDFALVTHQDDMTKVDLPHVVVDASADITRWRFDVNAHVNAVTGDCLVFSHEQGAGSKNASSIIEMILLDHILTCKGENVKIVVSDNASVGKNWLSTVAFPQYLVDQGLADIVLIVFLENNHGKWIADMLFGQFQIRKRNSTILGIDGLLQEFESINRPSGGRVRGYAVNPLACVDFAQVFSDLGYDTKPPKEFGFKNRNIHFAGACRPESKETLSPELKKFFVNALPEEEGMVRLCSQPPSDRPNTWRSFQDRWIDVPAASRTRNAPRTDGLHSVGEPPLVVPMDKGFAANGPGLVSKRTAEHVGFNALSFRGKSSFAELESEGCSLTQEAWPPGLLLAGEPGYESESLRCAPQNWVVRRSVRHYGDGGNNAKARYPPKNMLNALYCHGPRANGISVGSEETVFWIPTATYSESPMPIQERLSASEGLKRVAREHTALAEELNVLDVLRSIFESMGDRNLVSDPWFHKPATRPTSAAVERYNQTLRLLHEWDNVRPTPVLTMLQAFREDEDIKVEIEREIEKEGQKQSRTEREIMISLFEARMMRRNPERLTVLRKDVHSYDAEVQGFFNEDKAKRAVARELREQEKQNYQRRSKITTKLFEKKKLKPAALDRFCRLVEEDKQRFAEEQQKYREEEIIKFEGERNLLPFQGPLTQSSYL